MIYPPPERAVHPATALPSGRASGARDLALILVMTSLGAALTLHGFGLGADSLFEFAPAGFGGLGIPDDHSDDSAGNDIPESETENEFPVEATPEFDTEIPESGRQAATWVPPTPLFGGDENADVLEPLIGPTATAPMGWPGGNVPDETPTPATGRATDMSPPFPTPGPYPGLTGDGSTATSGYP